MMSAATTPSQAFRVRTRLTPTTIPPTAEEIVIFALNVHDFAYPELSAAIVGRVLDIHERHGVPLDVFLTTTVVSIWEASHLDLLARLRAHRLATVCYHIRPPLPYYRGFDWLGLRGMTAEDQAATVRRYETHAVDLATGQTTAEPGGFAHLADLLGSPPIVVGALCDAGLQGVVDAAYAELGALAVVVHGRPVNLGERRHGLLIRPEHVDLKLYEHLGRPATEVVDEAFAQAHAASGARAPYVVGIKMHDNDFFATGSAWAAVYQGTTGPPWDLGRTAPLQPQARQDAVLAFYEETVAAVAALAPAVRAINARDLIALLP